MKKHTLYLVTSSTCFMMKSLVVSAAIFFIHGCCFSQKSYQQPATLGIHFLFNDFETASAIRSSSLSTVLREKGFGKLKNMSPGLALSYSKGLSQYFDFSAMYAGSFLSYPLPDQSDTGNEFLLSEIDASVRGKMFTDRYWFVPYLQVGAGFSKYKGYWGAYIPVGVGIQISFFGEAYLHFNSQYRLAVSESVSYHFVHSIGLVGNIGKRE